MELPAPGLFTIRMGWPNIWENFLHDRTDEDVSVGAGLHANDAYNRFHRILLCACATPKPKKPEHDKTLKMAINSLFTFLSLFGWI